MKTPGMDRLEIRFASLPVPQAERLAVCCFRGTHGRRSPCDPRRQSRRRIAQSCRKRLSPTHPFTRRRHTGKHHALHMSVLRMHRHSLVQDSANSQEGGPHRNLRAAQRSARRRAFSLHRTPCHRGTYRITPSRPICTLAERMLLSMTRMRLYRFMWPEYLAARIGLSQYHSIFSAQATQGCAKRPVMAAQCRLGFDGCRKNKVDTDDFCARAINSIQYRRESAAPIVQMVLSKAGHIERCLVDIHDHHLWHFSRMAVAKDRMPQCQQRIERQAISEVSARSERQSDSPRTATIAAKRTRVFMNQNRTTRCSVTTGQTPALGAI